MANRNSPVNNNTSKISVSIYTQNAELQGYIEHTHLQLDISTEY